MSVPTKTCRKCGQTKPATREHFYSEPAGKYGLRGTCKACRQVADKARYEVNADRERAKARERFYANREARVKQQRAYNKANRDAVNAANRAAYHRDRDARVQRVAAYYRENPDAAKAKAARRRARRLAAPGRYTVADLRHQLEAQHHRCWWCHDSVAGNYHVDHRIPLSKGGTNDPSNLVIACAPCNSSKGAKLPHQWNGRLM